jgi:AraC-like DNA-binding protein
MSMSQLSFVPFHCAPMHIAPLRSFTVFETSDASAARAALIDTYGAKSFKVRVKDEFSVKASLVQVGGITLSYCDYASEVALSFPEANFIRQHICLSGNARIQRAATVEELTVTNWSGLVPPGMPVDYFYGPNTKQLVMWLDVQKLRRKASALLGDDQGKPIGWSGDSDRRGAAMASMRRAVEFLASELDTVGRIPEAGSGLLEIEDFIMVRFLFAHDHDQIVHLTQPSRSASGAQLKRLEEYISANWQEPLDVETMASVTGVSARSVFRYFQNTHGCSPQAFRKRIRLEKAKTRLGKREAGTTVIGVALSCGFQSLGHFARDYRSMFGELPSDTLGNSPRD